MAPWAGTVSICPPLALPTSKNDKCYQVTCLAPLIIFRFSHSLRTEYKIYDKACGNFCGTKSCLPLHSEPPPSHDALGLPEILF